MFKHLTRWNSTQLIIVQDPVGASYILHMVEA